MIGPRKDGTQKEKERYALIEELEKYQEIYFLRTIGKMFTALTSIAFRPELPPRSGKKDPTTASERKKM